MRVSEVIRSRRVPLLDGIRGVAVLLVITSHALGPEVEPMGAVGVTVFFVLSGYLITTLLLEEQGLTGRISRPRFYARRARRLLPALGVLLSAELAWRVAADVSLTPTMIAGAYGTNIALALGLDASSLGHTWSLALEEQFYLLWPLLLPLLMRRRPMVTITCAATASALGRVLLYLLAPWPVSFFGPLTRADAILVGCAVAIAIRQGWRPSKPRLAAGVGALLLAVSSATMGMPAAVVLIAPAAIATALLIAWATSGPADALASTLSWSPLRYTGRISYGLYLWHPLVLSLALDRHLPVLAFTIVGSFSIATVSWLVVERPMLRVQPETLRPAPSPLGV